MAVSKKSVTKKSTKPATKKPAPTKKHIAPAAAQRPTGKGADDAEALMPLEAPKKSVGTNVHPVALVVQAKDGKWVYGREEDEKKMEAMPKGKYDSAADASQAATDDYDTIINPSKPVPAKAKSGWGTSISQDLAQAATPAKTTSKKSGTTPTSTTANADTVSLKKVCADANIDPRLARRILRSKGKKPGGRWEWDKKDVAGVIALLKAESATEK